MPSFIVPMGGGGRPLLAGVAVAGRTKAAEVALTGLSVLGNGAAFALTLLPILSFVIPVFKDKGVGDRTVYGHMLTLLSSVVMVLYAAPHYPNALASLTINGASIVLQLAYVAVFVWFAVGAVRRHALYVLAPVLLTSIVLPLIVFTKLVGNMFISILAIIAVLLSYGFSLVDLVEAARIKRVENMDPLYEVLLCLVNACTSALCGSLAAKPDLHMAVPNFIGAVILLAYLAFYIAHREPPSAFHNDVRNLGYELGKMFKSQV